MKLAKITSLLIFSVFALSAMAEPEFRLGEFTLTHESETSFHIPFFPSFQSDRYARGGGG